MHFTVVYSRPAAGQLTYGVDHIIWCVSCEQDAPRGQADLCLILHAVVVVLDDLAGGDGTAITADCGNTQDLILVGEDVWGSTQSGHVLRSEQNQGSSARQKTHQHSTRPNSVCLAKTAARQKTTSRTLPRADSAKQQMHCWHVHVHDAQLNALPFSKPCPWKPP